MNHQNLAVAQPLQQKTACRLMATLACLTLLLSSKASAQECNPVLYEADCRTPINRAGSHLVPNNTPQARPEWPCGDIYKTAQLAAKACGPGVEVLRVWAFFGSQSRGWTCNCQDFSRRVNQP